jgi:hypothetical protein
LEEIERKKKKEKEKKKIMRKKYEENLRKKKSDEETLKKIKMEQEKKIKEINELRYKKQLDEQKFLLLTKGKLNKQQRKKYRNLIKSETKITFNNPNKLPFDLLFNEDNGDREKEKKDIIKKMKNDLIDKDYKLWNIKKNNFNNNGKNNIFKNKQLSYNNSGIEDYYHNNFNSNDNIINNDRISIMKKKNEKKNINTSSKFSEYMSFSPIQNLKKSNFNLSIQSDKDKNIEIDTDLHQIISFSPKNKIGQDMPEFLSRNSNLVSKDKRIIRTSVDEKVKNILYEQKNKKHHKNNNKKNIEDFKDNNNYEDNKNKNINENLVNEKDNLFNSNSNDNNSLNELNEIKDITSRLSNEVEKKIELINRNQNLFKTKSSPKLNPFTINEGENNKNINIKKPNLEVRTNIINKEESKLSKQKSFIEDGDLLNDNKKESLVEFNKLCKIKDGKKSKENTQTSFGNSVTFRDNKYTNSKMIVNTNKNKNKNKNKKEKIVYILKKDSKNYNICNQKMY